MDDAALDASLRSLLHRGRWIEASIVAHLAEVDARSAHLRAGKSSLFAYCVECLGLSEAEAFNRITAARLSRRYPLLLELLATGELHLSGICAARFYLTPENHRELLSAICGKSKRKIEELLAAMYPSVRADEASRPSRMKPLTGDRFLLEVVIDLQLKNDFELALDLLRHTNPHADVGWVIQRSVGLLLDKLQARRFGARQPKSTGAGSATRVTDAGASAAIQSGAAKVDPMHGSVAAHVVEQLATDDRAEPGDSTLNAVFASRDASTTTAAEAAGHGALKVCDRANRTPRYPRQHIPRSVRRAVVARDGLGCCFVGPDGKRCGDRSFLEFHHRRAWGRGGHDSVENLELLCRAHNRLVAELELGVADIADRIAERKGA